MTTIIPLSLLQQANEDCNLETLRVWCIIRELYRDHNDRPVVYRLKYDQLSKRTGISHTSLRKHVKQAVMLKWAAWVKSKDGNGINLVLTGIRKLKQYDREPVLTIKLFKSKREQILEFRAAIVAHNVVKQEKQLGLKATTIKNCLSDVKLTAREYKLFKKHKSVETLESSHVDCITLSNKSFGELFTKRRNGQVQSLSKHNRMQCKLRDAHYIYTKTRLKQVGYMTPDDYRDKYIGTRYIYNTTTCMVYERLSNEIKTANAMSIMYETLKAA